MTGLKLSTLSTEEKARFAVRLAQCWPVYEFEDDQAYYESLSPYEFHDAAELYGMRQRRGYNPETCRVAANDNDVARVALSVVGSSDTREQVQKDLSGESQAPPALSKAANRYLCHEVIKQIRNPVSRVAYEHMIRLADRGYSVFPTHSIDQDGFCTCLYTAMKLAKRKRVPFEGKCTQKPGKHPKTRNGVKDATTDFDQIVDWFYQDSIRLGETNIGLACGPAYGSVALDVDGPTGYASLRQLEAELGPLPHTLEVKTGSGGRHLYFSYPENLTIKNTQSAIGWEGSKIDVRGENGYAVIPPSRHVSGGVYSWVAGCSPDDVGLAELPEKWLKAAWWATKDNQRVKASEDKEASGEGSHQPAKSNPFVEAGYSGSIGSSLDAIGEGDSFNGPIYRALCSFFGKNGPDADCSDFLSDISDHVASLIKSGATTADRWRYTLRDGGIYLKEQAEKAAQFVRDNAHGIRHSEEEDHQISSALIEQRIDELTPERVGEIPGVLALIAKADVLDLVSEPWLKQIVKQTAGTLPSVRKAYRELQKTRKREAEEAKVRKRERFGFRPVATSKRLKRRRWVRSSGRMIRLFCSMTTGH